MSQANQIRQESPVPVYIPLAEVEDQESEIARLNALVGSLITDLEIARQERTIYQEECAARDKRISMLEAERERLRLEATRNAVNVDELRELRKRDRMIQGICETHHDQLGPYEKLVLIMADKQIPYSAAKHGGPPDVMITSMKRWNESIGDAEGQLNKVFKNLETCGTLKRELIDTGDGRKHYTVEINEQHLMNPRQYIRAGEGEERKHNGGNKRCPVCNSYCKKQVAITHLCEKCGIEYDNNMNPLDTGAPAPEIQVVPEPEPVEVKAAPVSFTEYQTGGKWPRRCRDHKNHRELWKMGIAGLECPRCGG